MKRQTHLVLIVLFLLMANLILAFQYRSSINKSQNQYQHQRALFNKAISDNELISIAWATSASISSDLIPKDYTDQLPENGALVIRITDKQCSSCIDQLIFEIRKYLNEIGQKNLIVMYSAKKEKHIDQAFRQRLLKSVKFIKTPRDLELTPLDKYNIPYLFLIDGTGHVKASFLPYPATEKFTGIFLNHIANQLNKSHDK